jgi:hypothetical protein
VKAVLRGEGFVGSRFAAYDFTGSSDGQSSPTSRGNKNVVLLQQQNIEVARRHEAGFYSDDAGLLDALTQFIGTALKAGSSAIVVATESHRDSLLPRLQARGLNMVAAIEQGRYISLDVADAISTFMINDLPDPGRFLKLFSDLIAKAAVAAKREQGRVAVFGEGVQLLWAQGNAKAAVLVEELSDQLAKTCDVDILCGYSLGSVQGGMDSQIFQQICAAHSAVHSG